MRIFLRKFYILLLFEKKTLDDKINVYSMCLKIHNTYEQILLCIFKYILKYLKKFCY